MKSKKALVFDLNFMGDMLMSSPAIRALFKAGYQVDVISWKMNREVLLANPFIDHVYTGFPFWEAVEARFRNYDLILQFNTSLKTNLYMLIAGKPRLGYYLNWRKGFPLTIRVPISQRTALKGNRVRECMDLLKKGLDLTCDDERMVFDEDSI